MLIARGVRARLADVRQLAGMCLLQIAIACALRYLRMTWLRRAAAACRPVARLVAGGSEERVLWAINAAGRRLPGVSTCLVRAIVAESLLGSSECPVCLTIGVRRVPAGLEAHAWVHRGKQVLVGGSSCPDYAPLITWPALAT
jgi:hypothetical protein